LELKIEEKDKIINEEKIKNDNLNNIIQNYLIDKNLQNRIIELLNEIKLFRKYCNFSEGEKLISIKFISGEKDIDYPIITKNNEIFLKLESMIYEKYPKYRKTINDFLVGENKINRNQTIEQNNIKNNDIITLIINN